MTFAELTPWLFSRTSGGIRWGLDRTERLLAGVGDPHRQFRSILIGGTNGKGSVAALCEAALRARGRGRVGLYTSPHLVSFAERIRIDGRPIDEERLAAAATRLRPAIEGEDASFFEATTALAFLLFAEAGVDLAVVEVGLGGRLDATNVLTPLVCAITNVARDHVEYLGDDLTQIAREKAGIFKPGIPALSGPLDPELESVLRMHAREVGSPFQTLGERAKVELLESTLAGTRFALDSNYWGRHNLEVPLLGGHQATNAALAAEILGLLPDPDRPSWQEVESGFGNVSWPGRLQLEKIRGTTFLFDVAHNPAGVAALLEAIDRLELPRPLVLLTAILQDKDWGTMLPRLVERADAAIFTHAPTAPESRRWDPEAAARWIAGATGRQPRVIPELDRALSRASTLAPHGTVLVTGSVHTVGDALQQLGRGVPGAMNFRPCRP